MREGAWHGPRPLLQCPLHAPPPKPFPNPTGWLQELSEYQSSVAVDSTPDPLRYLSYVFGLGNLLAGPQIEYVDYRDFMEHVREGLHTLHTWPDTRACTRARTHAHAHTCARTRTL